MSQAQLCEVCRVLCIIASTLTFVSAMGYFVFSKGSETEKAAQLQQLLSANQSLTARVAHYENDLLQRERRITEMEKERLAKAEESRSKPPEPAARERALSEQEALFLLAPPVDMDLASLMTVEKQPTPAPAIASARPRQLSPSQYHELVTTLQGAPPAQVEFLFSDADQEAAALARQLSSAISEAGFKKVVMPPPGKQFDWKPPVTGIRCAIAEGRPAPAMIEPLMRVLKKSGLQVDGVVNANVPKTDKPLLWIIVGARPPVP